MGRGSEGSLWWQGSDVTKTPKHFPDDAQLGVRVPGRLRGARRGSGSERPPSHLLSSRVLPQPTGPDVTCCQQQGRCSLAKGHARRAAHTCVSPRVCTAVPAAGSEQCARQPHCNPGAASATKKSQIITTFIKKSTAPPRSSPDPAARLLFHWYINFFCQPAAAPHYPLLSQERAFGSHPPAVFREAAAVTGDMSCTQFSLRALLSST